jgi:hypothetical protein
MIAYTNTNIVAFARMKIFVKTIALVFLRNFAEISASMIFCILPEILPPPCTTSVLFQPLLLGSPEGLSITVYTVQYI